MSGSRPSVGIRISAEGAEQARRQIEAIGPAGEAAMRRVAVASAAATPEMQRLSLASDVAQRTFAGMGGTLGRVGATFTGVSGVAAGLTAGFVSLGVAASVGALAIAKAGDAATATLARLTSATGGLGQAQQVYERLFALSQQTGIAVAESAGAFTRFSVAAKEIGGTTDQVLKLVAGIQKAGIVSGASAQETGAAVQQLGQALASGTLQGDELRSLLEGMPQLAQALARELGVGIGQLRQMGAEGKLSADVVFPALLRATEKISAEFDKMPVTMSRAKDILLNATEDFGARLDRITGLSQTFARFMQQGASALRAAGAYIAPTDREAVDQGVEAAQRQRANVARQIAADRAASAYGTLSPGLQQALDIADADLNAALARQAEIRRGDREMQRAEAEDAAAQARAAAQTAATLRLKDTSAGLDAQYKARQVYQDKIRKLEEDEAKGGTLPAGVTFAGLRAAAEKELAEALEKTAGAHAQVAKEAADANDHVLAYTKAQKKAADDVAAAQKKAAEEIERFHTRSFDAVANIGERAFDRVGDALVQAFVSGEGAAVNFGGVLRGVIASAVADIAKLAIVNPILNSVFTSSTGARPTLAGAFGGGGGSGFGSLSNLGGMASSGWDFLSSGGYFAGGGGFSGAMFGAPASLTQGMGAFGEAIPASAGLLGSGGSFSFAGLGSTLGGIGGGFGLGSALGGLIANSQAQQQNAQIGAALGSLLGSFGGPLGSLIGGTIGGGLGGLIGPKDSVKGWSYAIRSTGADDGWAQGDALKMDNVFYNESGKAQFDQANATIAAVNEYLAAAGLTVGGARAVGGNKDGPDDSWGGAASFGDAFASLRFKSKTDDRLTAYLGGQTFDDPAKLQQAVEGFKQAAAAIDALGQEAVPAFTASLKAVNDNFDAGVEQARKYGLAEENLTIARAKALATLEAQRAETLRQSDVSLGIRRLAAAGSSMEAELARQAETARLEIESFGNALDALALAAEDKSARLIDLEEVQAAERAAIIARWGEQAAQALRQAGSTIRTYLDGLATGTAAGASPTDRLAAAQAAFDRDRTLSIGGDRDALGRVTGSADALLSAGRDMFASSPAFQAILASVKGGLGSLPVVQSYDAMQAASLTAIQQAITAGTLNTSTVILPGGNVVSVANLGDLSGIAPALAALHATAAATHASMFTIGAATHAGLHALNLSTVGHNASTVALHQTAVALHATAASALGTAVNQLSALGSLGVYLAAANAFAFDLNWRINHLEQLGEAINGGVHFGNVVTANGTVAATAGFAALAKVVVDAAASAVAAQGAGNTIAAQAAQAGTASFAAMNKILVDSSAAVVTSIALSNALLAGILAKPAPVANDNRLVDINTSLGTVDASIRDVNASLATVHGAIVGGTSAIFGAQNAGNTIAADAANAATTVLASINGTLSGGFGGLTMLTAGGNAGVIAAQNAGNVIAFDAASATVAALNAANQIAASNTTLLFQSASAGNTIEASNALFANSQRAQMLAEIAALRQQVAALTQAVQQGATVTATEARAAGVRVEGAVLEVKAAIRDAA